MKSYTATPTTRYTLDLGDGIEIANASKRSIEGLTLWTGTLDGKTARIWTVDHPVGSGGFLSEMFPPNKGRLDDRPVVDFSDNVREALEKAAGAPPADNPGCSCYGANSGNDCNAHRGPEDFRGWCESCKCAYDLTATRVAS